MSINNVPKEASSNVGYYTHQPQYDLYLSRRDTTQTNYNYNLDTSIAEIIVFACPPNSLMTAQDIIDIQDYLNKKWNVYGTPNQSAYDTLPTVLIQRMSFWLDASNPLSAPPPIQWRNDSFINNNLNTNITQSYNMNVVYNMSIKTSGGLNITCLLYTSPSPRDS